MEGNGQTPSDTAIKLANIQLQASANRQYDNMISKGGKKSSGKSRKYKSNTRIKSKVKKTKQNKRKQLKYKNKTKNKKIY